MDETITRIDQMSIEEIRKFSNEITSKIDFDYDLKKSNWFNIGGQTKVYFRPDSLPDLILFLKKFGEKEKIHILGAGSNTLISDEKFDGVVIKLGKNFSNISILPNDVIIAGSACLDKKLSDFALNNGIGGFEFLTCIPGTIGGGLKMNAGCFNKEFKDVLVSIQAIDKNGQVLTIPASKVIFKYRSNDLKEDLIFLSASFKGSRKNQEEIKKEILELKEKKDNTQPTKLKTSGSTFKNPINQTDKKVWELIKESVALDTSFGDAQISNKHCNFFVNKNNASFKDMNKLIEFVKTSVEKKTGIVLEKEIKILNKMKKKILILSGGISKERLISLDTGKQVAKELIKNGYKVLISEPDKNLSKDITLFKPDVIFNALHGQFGEDGYIQTILETKKIPYTHSGIIASSIAMDKEISKKIFIKNKILTPKYIKFNHKKNKYNIIKLIEKKLKFPVVAKPINEGSSVHVYICDKTNIIKNLKALRGYNEILIEEFIPGREIQVAIMDNKILGAIELEPKRTFYDYEAKYNLNAKTKHLIPVDLSKNNLAKISGIAREAHKIIGCKGVTRSDFKFFNGKFYLLEINTQPGMTKLSLVPEIAKYKGISFIKLIEWILKDASIKR